MEAIWLWWRKKGPRLDTGDCVWHRAQAEVSLCHYEIFHGPSGSKKEGAGAPEIVADAGSTLPIAKEATAYKVYLRVIREDIKPQHLYHFVRIAEIQPLEIHSFLLEFMHVKL